MATLGFRRPFGFSSNLPFGHDASAATLAVTLAAPVPAILGGFPVHGTGQVMGRQVLSIRVNKRAQMIKSNGLDKCKKGFEIRVRFSWKTGDEGGPERRLRRDITDTGE